MKNLTLILVASLLICSSFTKVGTISTFSITEMESLSIKNLNDFETYTLSKGYSFQSQVSTATTKIYFSDLKRQNGKPDQIARTEHGLIINYGTTEKQYYLDFKTALGKNGYKFSKQEENTYTGDVTTWFYYLNSKTKHTAVIYSYTIDGITWYNHQVFKTP